MKLLLSYFLISTCIAFGCRKPKVSPTVYSTNISKTDSKKDLDINGIDDGGLPVVCESDSKKGQIRPEDVNKINSSGYTLLLKAVMKNDLVKAKELLLLESDPNIARGKSTPISWAVHNKNKEMVSLLLSYGAEITFGEDGISSIFNSLEVNNNREILDIILCHFASKGKKDSVGLSPIHWSCRDGHLSVVKYLLEKDPSLVHNAENPYKFTALHWAARRGFREIVELLVSKGASKTAMSKSGFTPLMLAISNKHEELKSILSPDGYSLYPDLVKEDWKCSICLDSFNAEEDKVWTVIPLECGHKFHLRCITTYVSRKRILRFHPCASLVEPNHCPSAPTTCPNCRENLSFKMEDFLFGLIHVQCDKKICDVELGSLLSGLFVRDKINLVTQILLDLIRQGARVNLRTGCRTPMDCVYDTTHKSILSEAGGIRSGPFRDIKPAFGLSGSKIEEKILFGEELEPRDYYAEL